MEVQTYLAVSPVPGPGLAFEAPALVWAAPALLLLALVLCLAALMAQDRRGKTRLPSLAHRSVRRWKQALAGLAFFGRMHVRRPEPTVSKF